MFPAFQNQQESNLQLAEPLLPIWLSQAYFYSNFCNFAIDLTLQSLKNNNINTDATKEENPLKEDNEINSEIYLSIYFIIKIFILLDWKYDDYMKKFQKSNKLDANKSSIFLILSFLIRYHHQINQTDFQKIKESLDYSPKLLEVFIYLNDRFSKNQKSKEEKYKFLFRKSFKFMKKNFEEEKKGLFKRDIKNLFYETYFPNFTHQKTFSKKSFPFMKRINQRDIDSLFSNANYQKEFELFLNNFEDFFVKENQKKIKKLSEKIFNLITENKCDEITLIQPFPWKFEWMLNCKNIGIDILRKQKKYI